jgi:hypothetical protein
MKQQVVKAHRSIFIGATAILAVGTSRLASDAGDVGSWLLTIGSASLMYFSDICSEIDRASITLAQSADESTAKAREDLFDARAPGITLPAMGVGLLAVVIGFVWPEVRDLVF